MADSGLNGQGSWTPAFEGQRPPFEPGNQVALQHGVYSMRVRQEMYDQVLPRVEAQFPAAPRWWHESYSVACVAEEVLTAALLRLGVMRGDEPRAVLLKELRAQVRLKLELLREIGATPAAAAKVFRDAAAAQAAVVDAEAVAERGRRAREEREARERAAS